MSKWTTDIISEKEFWVEQNKLSQKLKPRVTHKILKEEISHFRGGAFGIKEIQVATLNSELVIDKVCILNYPLNDQRTQPELRELYLAQEELMMQPEDLPEEELSSPAKEQKQEDLTGITNLKSLTEDQVALFSKANYDYLHKIFPELNQNS